MIYQNLYRYIDREGNLVDVMLGKHREKVSLGEQRDHLLVQWAASQSLFIAA